MEPVTHVLTGACLARAGLNRRAAYATAGMAIAAELPDIDTLWSLHGPISGFQHHRGITHTLLGLPFEAAALLGVLILFHRIRTSGSRHKGALPGSNSIKPETAAPVRWAVLYGGLILALLSHILLDYTNNYGVRPFFPFNAHWYAASLVFIFDPLLFLLLLGGLLLPSLFTLVAREVGERRKVLRGAGWARVALVAVVMLWLVRFHEHRKAITLAESQVMRSPATDAELQQEALRAPDPADAQSVPGQPDSSPRRALLAPEHVLADPDPLSPFRWYTAADYGPAYQLGTVDTIAGAFAAGPTLHKPASDALLTRAEQTHLGRVFLDWSMMPWVTEESFSEVGSASGVKVTFQDLRFMGSTSLLHRGGKTPLTGEVVLSRSGEVLDESMDGRSGR